VIDTNQVHCAAECAGVTTDHGFTGIESSAADTASAKTIDPQRSAYRSGDDRRASCGR